MSELLKEVHETECANLHRSEVLYGRLPQGIPRECEYESQADRDARTAVGSRRDHANGSTWSTEMKHYHVTPAGAFWLTYFALAALVALTVIKLAC